MKRGIHELSDYERSEVADELMLPTGVFGAVLVAGLLCLGLVWHPQALFERAAAPAARHVAFHAAVPPIRPKMQLSGRQASTQNPAAD